MKNLKKVLSLALALIMVCGLMMSASAVQDVTKLGDWDDVQNKDAVEFLNAFEIMQGDDKGFRPDDNVTRAEAIKMIAVALWGGVDDGSLYNTGNVGNFDDVSADFWARGHINFGVVKEIIAGKGNGKFDPRGNVTGYELMKMCLVALGYGAEEEGLVGPSWDIRTMAIAQKIGLTEGYKGNPSQALTRDETALIVYNMIFSQTVLYSDTTGKLVVSANNDGLFGVVYLNMSVLEGILVSNRYADLYGNPIDDVAKITGYIRNSYLTTGQQPGWVTRDTAIYNFETSIDLIGRNVTVYYKNDRTSSTVVAIMETAGMNNIVPLKSDFVSFNETTGGAQWFTNYTTSAANAYAHFTATNEVIRLDNDGDNRADIVFVINYSAAYVSNINASKATTTFTGTNSATFDNVNVFADEDLVRGDIVVYYKTSSGAAIVKFPAVNEGVMTKMTSSNGTKTFTIDGVNYTGANIGTWSIDYTVGAAIDETIINKTDATFYTFNGSVVLYKGKVEPSKYAVIYAAKAEAGFPSGWTAQVAAILDDGTSATYTISNATIAGLGLSTVNATNIETYYAGAAYGSQTSTTAKLFTYAKNDTTGAVSFRATNPSTATAIADYAGGSNRMTFTVAGPATVTGVVDADSVAFYYGGTPASWKVATGLGTIPEIKTMTSGGSFVTTKNAAGADVLNVAMIPVGTPTTATAPGVYVILSNFSAAGQVNGFFKYNFTYFDGATEKEGTYYSATNQLVAGFTPAYSAGQVYTTLTAGAMGGNAFGGQLDVATGKIGFITQCSGGTLVFQKDNGTTFSSVIEQYTAATKFYKYTSSYLGNSVEAVADSGVILNPDYAQSVIGGTTTADPDKIDYQAVYATGADGKVAFVIFFDSAKTITIDGTAPTITSVLVNGAANAPLAAAATIDTVTFNVSEVVTLTGTLAVSYAGTDVLSSSGATAALAGDGKSVTVTFATPITVATGGSLAVSGLTLTDGATLTLTALPAITITVAP